MIYTNSITNAVYTMLNSDIALQNSGATIAYYQAMNTDPDNSFWVNVSMPSYVLDPFRANINEPWMAQYSIPVFTQITYDPNDTMKGIQTLDELTNRVFTVINSDRGLMGTVNNLIGFDVSPFDIDLDEEDYMFTNVMNIIAEVFA